MLASIPDLLRLLAVPALGWAAWRDVRTRRVPNVVWYPLAALGVVLLVLEAAAHLRLATLGDRLYFVRVAVSLGLVVPLSYAFWRLGGFGGADAKALMALAVLLPTFPTYRLATLTLPATETALGVFSMTLLTNTVLLGATYPVALAARNALAGDRSRAMFLGRRVPVSALSTAHGRLFETREGFTRHGLDLDALRMYLRWRGLSLADLRDSPEAFRDPASVGETHDPTDGAVGAGPLPDGGLRARRDRGDVDDAAPGSGAEFADAWAAEAFLDSIDGSAYGTTPEALREGLALVVERDEVWISPGIPFIVPMFAGLVVGLTYGDLLFGVLGWLGVL
jgi:preflagellin peptidase FlaK